ncbi:Oidioi.mRNA.OKI2018_I69.PAR.g12184.t1.cds [Oikopleura dioica]|uniref:Uridylate-specific endoribonuclease n=1 Tax=Oikopleura dioica TaxID=34765 RepID=A0ABN7S3G4_OIKDI|nr:Oidioi.mRNA.OKI2018_I69.PAR.g12184.t1.cds [Oikopleura dioica]
MEFIEKVRDMDDEERDALWAEFSEFSNLLWNYDGNAAIVGQDFEIDLGGRTRYNDDEDKAEDPLFSSVSEDLINRKTYYTFMRLMDNYSSETGVAEDISEEEIEEQWSFLDAICESDVIWNIHQWLVSKELAPEDMDEFKECLNNVWFNMYGRSYETRKRRTEDSSAFEHIFVGETRDGEVLGFHNWMRFYQLEKHGILDYKGYYPKYGHEDDDSPVSITIKFACEAKGIDVEKPKGGFLLGTSPEFEIGLYTAALVLSGGRDASIPITLRDYDLKIKVYCKNNRFMTAYCA